MHRAKVAHQGLSALPSVCHLFQHMLGMLATPWPCTRCHPTERCAARKKTLWRRVLSAHRSPQRLNLASSFLSLFGFSSEAEQSLDSESKTYCARSKIPERKNRSACFAICSHRREDKTEGVEVGVGGGSGVENEGYNWNGPPRAGADNTGESGSKAENGRFKVQNGTTWNKISM